MNYLVAILTTIVPLLVLFIPGIFIARFVKPQNIFQYGAHIILWSIGIITLTSLTSTFIGLPVATATTATILLIIALTIAYRKRAYSKTNIWTLASVLFLLTAIYTTFSVPALLLHDGLPTGDSQKAIIWAQKVMTENSIPDYSISTALLNRDPVDFYTPALHTSIAFIMQASATPLMSVSLFAIAIAIAVAWIGAAIAKEVFEKNKSILFPLLTALFILTNFRFLRYLREPGYHLQNAVGELFLFGLIFMGIRLTKEWNWKDAILAIICTISLIFTHQFSTFIAIFALIPIAIAIILNHKKTITDFLKNKTWGTPALIALIISITTIFITFDLHKKIPHLFTTTPHLSNLLPSLASYPHTMGIVWFLAGIAGLILITIQKRWLFFSITLIILALSQGPLLFIDIPPIRALFYSIVPLSICVAWFFTSLIQFIQKKYKGTAKIALISTIAIVIAITTISSTNKAYASLSHSASNNSTLTPELLMLADTIYNTSQNKKEAVLTDDYNKRSSSWLTLSNQPMFTRIAANLERQMNEADQNKKRYDMYLNQLDYEKIFSLASKPEAIQLMKKHEIKWVTGIQKTSADGFTHNPLLKETAMASNTTLFSPIQDNVTTQNTWLLRPTTLANDIGDREDTFEHLPASIRSARLSEPLFNKKDTYRETNAPLIPLAFNVGDYVEILWDKENTGRPDTSVDFYIQFTNKIPKNLTISTPSGNTYTLEKNTINISANDLPFDDKGFITITINNPQEQTIAIDLIALGLANTP